MNELSQLFLTSGIECATEFDLCTASTFKIGGKADIAVFPKNEDERATVVSFVKRSNSRFEIRGNGSNVLFSDEGYRGIIIFTKNMSSLSVDNNKIIAGCGTKLISVSRFARDNSLSGLEFANGIPASIGGAVAMNAGAYGSEISNVLVSSRAFNTVTEEFITLSKEEHLFDYRKSIYSEKKELICVCAELELYIGDKNEIDKILQQNTESRRQKQPLNLPSCGSYFKRPVGYFAAKLIDDCSLKGLSVGGAQVSEKHAGFIVNTGSATANDVITLAQEIKRIVYEKFGVILQEEVKYIY